jgi:peptidoglycan/xylan/chitin deacetylase (PgdA/CDA1 family)
MVMRRVKAAFCWVSILIGATAANAGECPGNSNAIGTSRIISIDPTEHARLGSMQYAETLPLADKEIVLTFDDGPLPPYTDRILDVLASECVKATYFIVGGMARAYPDALRRIYAAGHTIGTHSQNHPMTFNQMPLERVQNEIEQGIATTAVALGNRNAVAPFFRIPGLARSTSVEIYLHDRSLVTWSADFLADDWKHIQASEVLSRALSRIEAKGKGILLLHDIHQVTVLALPPLLRELKARGYRIVHVVPASLNQPKTASASADWVPVGNRRALPIVNSASAKPSIAFPRAMAATSTEPVSHPNTSALGRAIPIRMIRKCGRASEWHQLMDVTTELQYCQD